MPFLTYFYVYEDYQSIYEETMKKTEKQYTDDERRYDGKKREREREVMVSTSL